MKISIVAATNMRDVLEHTKTISLGNQSDTTHILWDYPHPIPENLENKKHINNCHAASKLVASKELMQAFRQEFGMVEGEPAFYLYGFISPSGLGQMIEMTSKHSFMVGDIGPVLGFVQNAALACGAEIFQALPTLRGLVDGLIEIGYCGEVTFVCTHDFQICDLLLGHQVAGFSCICEIGKQSPQMLFEFAGGDNKYELHEDRIVINTLLSYPPYPYSTETPYSILAPTASEKHMYRFKTGRCELAYVATWGLDVQEAKRRCRRTIDSCRNYYSLLQYRVDFGWKDKFYLNTERHVALGG